MGGKKKKKNAFIDKKNAATYFLLPGNNADEASSSGVTKRHVTWVRTDVNAMEDVLGSDGIAVDSSHCFMGNEIRSNKDHSDTHELLPADRENLGLPDDGYDYSRHLRVCARDAQEPSELIDEERSGDFTLNSFVPEILSKDRERGTAGIDKEIEDTMKMLDDYNFNAGASEYDSLQDNIFELANGRIGMPIDMNAHEMIAGTSALRLDSSMLELNKMEQVSERNSEEKISHDSTFDRIMSEYSNEDIGASTVIMPERREFTEVAQTHHDLRIHDSANTNAANLDKRHMEVRADELTFSDVINRRGARAYHIQSRSYDCESVLSMHSNVSHHPKLIGDSYDERRNVLSIKDDERLKNYSQKIEVTPVVANDFPLEDQTWRSNINRKGESALQKKERKAAVKEGRKHARMLKKGMKDSFQNFRKEMSFSTAGVSTRPNVSVRTLQ